jgi:prephenate dehydratase
MKSGSTFPYQVRVAYQGEPGAYSEKATRELLGQRVITVPYESFEDAFKAVASREVDYAVVPIENSLGGSIHTNFDLLLRYDLNIIAEHEFRVEHSLLALPGVDKKDIKKVMSHPQALAQCDNYLRNWGVSRESTYDTAGSAKMIKEKNLKDCAAIASDLAGATYGMNVLDSNIEDDDNNYTRFLLLSRLSVSSLIPPSMPAKTSIVYLLPNNPGALYKALACFSLRDIDCCKIESRPTSVQLLQFLNSNKIKNSITQLQSASQDLPRFQYTFYLDYLASEFDDVSQSALNHLKEQSQFVRVLGSYPKGGQLIGPIKAALEDISQQPLRDNNILLTPYIPKRPLQKRLKIGIVGFGKFGQFLAKTFVKNHDVYCVSKDDRSVEAKQLGCVDFFPLYDLSSFTKIDFDVIVLAVSIISFEDVVRSLPRDFLRNRLVVDVLSVKVLYIFCYNRFIGIC